MKTKKKNKKKQLDQSQEQRHLRRGSCLVENGKARKHQAVVLVVGDILGHVLGLKYMAQEHTTDSIGAWDRVAMGDVGLRGNEESRTYSDKENINQKSYYLGDVVL